MRCCNLLIVISFLLFALACRQKADPSSITVERSLNAFEQYIQTPDSVFAFEPVAKTINDGTEIHVLKMVSQNWLTTREVNDPRWWHWLTIVRPATVTSDTALLWIGGGSRESDPPREADPLVRAVAEHTSTITAHLHNIPNQPLEFVGDDYGPRYEDELIAYGWRKYLEGGAQDIDAIWLSRFPMVKAVVRAMDVVSEYGSIHLDQNLSSFTISGASKRGWTTWMTAVADERVIAIAPVVIDMLNVIPSFGHHWKTYGFWAPAVNDYVEEGIMDWQHTAEYRQLTQLVEPYSYRDRLTIPKLMINATGDQFFLPDSWQFYWNELQGEKHLRYIPNADHSLRETDAINSLISFHDAIVKRERRPDVDWRVNSEHFSIDFNDSPPADTVKLWRAHNRDNRDFRLETIGPGWTSVQVKVNSVGEHQIDISAPEIGWSAFFVEFIYNREGLPFKFTTGVKILPDSLPHGAYQPQVNNLN